MPCELTPELIPGCGGLWVRGATPEAPLGLAPGLCPSWVSRGPMADTVSRMKRDGALRSSKVLNERNCSNYVSLTSLSRPCAVLRKCSLHCSF